MRETLERGLLSTTSTLLFTSQLKTLKVEVVECELPTRSLKTSLNFDYWRLQLGKGVCPHYKTLKGVNKWKDLGVSKIPERSMAHCRALWQKSESACCSFDHAWLCSPPRVPYVQLRQSICAPRNLSSQLLRASPLWQNLTRPRLGQAASIAAWQTVMKKVNINSMITTNEINHVILSSNNDHKHHPQHQ